MCEKNIVIISPYAYMVAAIEVVLKRDEAHYRLIPLLMPMIFPQSPIFLKGWLKPDTVVIHVANCVKDLAYRTLDNFYATCSPGWRTLILFDMESAHQLPSMPCICQQADAILSSAAPLSRLSSILLKQDTLLSLPQEQCRSFPGETLPGANAIRWRA
ncbi:hypothetical protein H8I69_18545 [Serratia fonticola]|uniref:hypothetical protein n=1 Tax=Serratia fonticola TaxID=47917 RepID=UPI0015C5CA91|nr:hypothetical protein [Serratia fonticola]MBC3381123.1 hypothetical protein [Serratia fonticola]NYA40322.1 hypothetical protein [Serratia fonticola]